MSSAIDISSAIADTSPDTSPVIRHAMDSAGLNSEVDSDGRPEREIEIGILRIHLEEANERIRSLHSVIQDAMAAVRGTIYNYDNLNRALENLTAWNDRLYELQ